MSTASGSLSAKRARFEPSTTPVPPPKRVKRQSESSVADTPDNTTSSRKQRTKQQTLTQIDFVRSHTSHENNRSSNDDLTEIGELSNSNSNATDLLCRRTDTPTISSNRAGSVRKLFLKKRDSTLTQMDFFRDIGQDEDGTRFDDGMIGEDVGDKYTHILTFDGTADTPTTSVNPRRSKSSTKRRAGNRTEEPPIKEDNITDDRTYQKRKRRKTNHERTPASKNMGESEEIMTTPNDRALRPRQRKNAAEPFQKSRQDNPAPIPVHEIRETAQTDSSLTRTNPAVMPPVTPTKPRDRIPSSQSPESIVPSTKTNKRRPLAEKSANIRISPVKSAKGSPFNIESWISPKRKICVLKVPPRTHLPHSSRVEDSQHDIWSIIPTSSASVKKHSVDTNTSAGHHEIQETPSKPSTPVIESMRIGEVIQRSLTPKSFSNNRTSLGENYAKFKNIDTPAKRNPKPTEGADGKQSSENASSQEKLFEGNGSDRYNVMAYDQDPVNMIPEYSEITTDELSDLGSPVPNETQFVRDLMERISSPIPDIRRNDLTEQRNVSPSRLPSSIASLPIPSLRKTPIPTPRLIHTSPNRFTRNRNDILETSSLAEKPPIEPRSLLQHGSSSVQITRVPLNDTNSYTEWKQTSSSSPLLPPQPNPHTISQNSIYPASMPHPSQISTQAPSQLSIPSSSAPKSQAGLHESEVDKITIRDSSSAPAGSSQYKRYITDENGGDNLAEIGDSEQEDDLDLDPNPASFRTVTAARSRRGTRRDVTQSANPVATSNLNDYDDDVTQTPTQKVPHGRSLLQRRTTTQSSPVITKATTKSQRDAILEVIAIPSSSPPMATAAASAARVPEENIDNAKNTVTPLPAQVLNSSTTLASPHHNTNLSNRAQNQNQQTQRENGPQAPPSKSMSTTLPSSPSSSSVGSSPSPRPLKRRYSPIPGFDNDTQSDFTQYGHVTAARVHRMREDGLLPDWFVPQPYRAQNWSGRSGTKKQNRTKLRKKVG